MIRRVQRGYIPLDWDEVRRVRAVLKAGALQKDADGFPIKRMAQCGTCGLWWNDARISSLTPVPSARCPFETAHV